MDRLAIVHKKDQTPGRLDLGNTLHGQLNVEEKVNNLNLIDGTHDPARATEH